MDKILRTQMSNIYNHIDAQSEEIEIAARLIAQAVAAEGRVLIKMFDDFSGIEDLLIKGNLSLGDVDRFDSAGEVTTPDRVLVVAVYFNEDVKEFVRRLQEEGTEFVLVASFNKHESDFLDNVDHYLDLNSPRELVPTPNFDKIVNPYINVFMYLYYHLYLFVDEMTNPEYE